MYDAPLRVMFKLLHIQASLQVFRTKALQMTKAGRVRIWVSPVTRAARESKYAPLFYDELPN